jgi:hypothetical protein
MRGEAASGDLFQLRYASRRSKITAAVRKLLNPQWERHRPYPIAEFRAALRKSNADRTITLP